MAAAPRPAGRGFTLLELVIVLFLAGLIAALVVPSFSGTLESSRLQTTTAATRADTQSIPSGGE